MDHRRESVGPWLREGSGGPSCVVVSLSSFSSPSRPSAAPIPRPFDPPRRWGQGASSTPSGSSSPRPLLRVDPPRSRGRGRGGLWACAPPTDRGAGRRSLLRLALHRGSEPPAEPERRGPRGAGAVGRGGLAVRRRDRPRVPSLLISAHSDPRGRSVDPWVAAPAEEGASASQVRRMVRRLLLTRWFT